ncbi:MAG TPA: RNA polymerase subunit sigma [Alteromonas macleodii]|jgi:RNA polymerase sigma-70 factor (ECF subfamily)|uniref:sigma-70 family RNA polymerase sigma factor n=1 Tax=Alteromonas TaxID=226 RepID=UPI000C5CD56C|nr:MULTISPECIES: sigma-70 family RNA polymerase sigma factor [Alteromonas]MAL71087.1 RNA polymerase subunit sigma [Alteromonas sp.]MEC8747404.1 sigma-70 family RNA polymerase sigma factor [Pseudomonadota bacterium]MAW02542.1 RNA polymerase subunit sigma [Alteromonas sp.]MCG7655562.1 sigma-70 family RNA polymerase sigma factor [Alteromonas sp. Cnat2-8]MDK2762783.1 sigma-70 family RNA polymerase sigma factor [Alteromonas macleodii]|tara:strand:- start:3133 stop:3732 length:600 start_codon:yes stop_codon:yes gene_type:complete
MNDLENEVIRLSDRLSQLSDDELVRIAKLQLPYVTTAYETIFHRYHKKLLQICFRYLKSAEEAEETVNDTLLIVFNKINQFEERAKFRTWLYKIAHNQALTRLRKKQAEHVELNEALPEIEKHEEQSQQDHTNEQQQLNKLLDLLSLEERSIVVFRMTGNLEFSEISQILDVKLSAVKMRYKRALEKMAVSAKKSHVSE